MPPRIITFDAHGGALRAFDWVTGDKVRELTGIFVQYDVSDVAAPNDGKLLAVGTTRGAGIKLYDAETFEIVNEAKRVQMAESVCFSPDGKYLAFGGGYAVIGILSLPSLDVCNATRVHEYGALFDLDISPTSERLVSGFGSGAVMIWKVPELTKLYTNTQSISKVFTVKFLSEDRVVTGNSSNTVRLWDVDRGSNTVVGGHGQEVQCMALSHDGSIFASGSYDNTVAVYDSDSLGLINTIACEPMIGDIDDEGTTIRLTFFDNDTIIVCLRRAVAMAYDVRTGQPVKTLGSKIYRPRGAVVVGREGERRAWNFPSIPLLMVL